MARKEDLRRLRTGTVINLTSTKQESEIASALKEVEAHLGQKFGAQIGLIHQRQWLLSAIVEGLNRDFPESTFECLFPNTAIRPDGGILYLLSNRADDILSYPILISEVKNQGTNDSRVLEGMGRQAKGNAIERLGKNVIGLRAALMRESIFPFVCFGYGCDFEPDSSILDRVSTIAIFGKLNTTYLHNELDGRLNRGSFYFRPAKWTVEEMATVMKDIAERSVQYYFSKYGESHFITAQ